MQAGKMRNRVTIQQQSTGSDDYGQPLQVWSGVATVWADIRIMGGIESIKAGAAASVVKASIRIRRRTGINSGMRVVDGSTVYNITAVLPDEAKKQHIDLACEVVQ